LIKKKAYDRAANECYSLNLLEKQRKRNFHEKQAVDELTIPTTL
jgi:hypothetical protein